MEQYFLSAKYSSSKKNYKRSYLASERSEKSHNLVGCLVGDGHVKGPVEHVCNFLMKILDTVDIVHDHFASSEYQHYRMT